MGASTKDQQVKEVAQGLALGLLAIGVESLPSGRPVLSLSFNQAWRNWSKSTSFPSFERATFPGDMFLRGASKSARRQGAFAAWDLGRRARPYLLATNLDIEDYLEIVCDESLVPQDWIDFANRFVEAFKPNEVTYLDAG